MDVREVSLSHLKGGVAGLNGGAAEATEVSYGGECDGEGWLLTNGMVSLSWWFYGGLLSELARSRILSSLVREKITFGCAIASILPSATSCISSSSLIYPARSGVLSVIVGEFLVNST